MTGFPLTYDQLRWLFALALTLHNLEEAIWLPKWSQHAGRWHLKASKFQFRFAVLVLTLLAYGIVLWSYWGGKGSRGRLSSQRVRLHHAPQRFLPAPDCHHRPSPSDSLHPNRSGDVVVVLKPPYQFDAPTLGQRIAFSQFFGHHGYLPETVDLASSVNMHAVFVAAGPGIRHQDPVVGVRAIDLAPTISFLMNFPGPINARGKILFDMFPSPGQYKEATILSLSDYHGRIVPEAEAADNVSGTGTTNASFSISGAAYLKPWIDLYRVEARNGSIFVTGGDSVGATQPISNFFGDKPTIYALNMMGLDADTGGMWKT